MKDQKAVSEAPERILLRRQARDLTKDELAKITGGLMMGGGGGGTASGMSCTTNGDEDCGADD
jgi:bacteriocin-like protein